jgi:hypothetical protein
MLSDRPDRGQVMRLVQRRKLDEPLQFGEDLIVHAHRRIEPRSTMHDAMANGGDRLPADEAHDGFQQRASGRDMVEAVRGPAPFQQDFAGPVAYRQRRFTADALNLAPQRRRPVRRRMIQSELDAGGTGVKDSDHPVDELSPASLGLLGGLSVEFTARSQAA